MKQLLTLFILCFSLSVLAQPPHPRGPRGEKFKKHRVAYLTDKLDLSIEEAQLFWPVFNAHDKERESLHDQRRKLHESMNPSEMSDAEIEKMLDREIKLRQALLALDIQYEKQYRSIISVRKVALLYRAEEDFKRDLFRKMRKRNGPGPDGEGRRGNRRGGGRP